MAILLNPNLMSNSNIMQEAKEKATKYLKINNFSIGAYSDSKGILLSRQNISKWYKERDEGYEISPDDIYLCHGSMSGYDHIISLICETGDSVILPSPCYPLYEIYNKSCGVENIFYSFEGIEEGKPSKVNLKDLTEKVHKSKSEGKSIKALVVTNPQIPLGTVMTEDEMTEIINFCEINNLVLIAFETLQNSIYPATGTFKPFHSDISNIKLKDSEGNVITGDKQFKSFRYVMHKTQSPLEMFSVHSISKGPFFK